MFGNMSAPSHRKDFILILLLLILIIALPITLFLVQTRQDIRPRARTAQGPAKLFLTAPGLTNLEVSQNQTFSVDIYLDPSNKTVSAVEAHLIYPQDKLEVIGKTQINTDAFPSIVRNDAGNGTVDIGVGIGL